jgi:uncharacterized protein (TIGR04255 family)
MPFPESNRVIYRKNPLVEVICQFRFHTILRIDAQEPIDYQEKIREYYPIFREKMAASAQLPAEILQQLPQQVRGSRSYEFAKEENLWVVSRNKEFIALTSHAYKRWEDFREHLVNPFNALIDIYKPSPFLRIGLRYQNVIKRSKLGLENVEWSELLQPYIAGELSEPNIKEFVHESAHNVVIKLDQEDMQVRLQHGFTQDEGDGEICYLIDSDFFTNRKTEATDGIDTLEIFNRKNRHLFRWCITDRVHEAMEPQPI